MPDDTTYTPAELVGNRTGSAFRAHAQDLVRVATRCRELEGFELAQVEYAHKIFGGLFS